VKSRAGSSHGSPRSRGGHRNSLVGIEEDAGASISPKMATAEATLDGRSGQATAAAIQIANELERERGERVRAGLGQLTNPDPSRLA
jgi:hypothetical protein